MAAKLPDRSGMLILPFGVCVMATWFAIALVLDAIELGAGRVVRSTDSSARVRLVSDMIGALSEMLGVIGSYAVAGAVGVAGVGWLGVSIVGYRRVTAADRRAAGVA